MDDSANIVLNELIQIARRKGLTTYSEVGELVGLDMGTDVGRIRIAQILDEINAREVNLGHPMISALVIYKDKYRPGPGFFNCARGLGQLTDRDEDGFWAKEVARVQDYWASH